MGVQEIRRYSKEWQEIRCHIKEMQEIRKHSTDLQEIRRHSMGVQNIRKHIKELQKIWSHQGVAVYQQAKSYREHRREVQEIAGDQKEVSGINSVKAAGVGR